MFSTNDTRLLRKTLNSYPVPMFAVERATPSDAFRILCVNQEHERASGLVNDDVEGLRPSDLLPPHEAEAVESRYDFCAKRRKVIQYEETLHLNGMPSRWRTILHPVKLGGDGQRVIGTAFPVEPRAIVPANVLQISDFTTKGKMVHAPALTVMSGVPDAARRRIAMAEVAFHTQKAEDLARSARSDVANGDGPDGTSTAQRA